MRTLILLRHAHAEPASDGQADVDRALSAEGLAEAEAAGRWLSAQGLVPDRVLCSPARRTRETLEAVLGNGVGFVEQRLVDAIYEATAGALAELVDEHHEVERGLVVRVRETSGRTAKAVLDWLGERLSLGTVPGKRIATFMLRKTRSGWKAAPTDIAEV